MPLSLRVGRVVLLATLFAPAVAAQPVAPRAVGCDGVTRIGQAEQTVTTAPGYYRHHMPGEATIQVQVSGNVVSPGLYEVADETDLRRLLALAGGPQVDIRNPDSDRRVELRLVRPERGLVYGALLADAAANPSRIPPLCSDDALLVEVVDRRQFGWRDGLTVVGAIGTLAFALSQAGVL